MGKQGMMGGPAPSAEQEFKKDKTEKSPWTIAFAVFVVAGLLVGLVLPLTAPRRRLLAACVLGAIVSLAVPTAVGFPLAREIDKDMQKMKSEMNAKADPGNPMGMMMGNQMAAGMGEAIKVRYTPWFYLTWGFIAASLALVVVEAVAGGVPKPAAAPAAVNPGPIT
jgi:hypothetical protein